MLRRTRRAYIQQGGAAWRPFADDERNVYWSKVLPKELQFILDSNWARSPTVMQDYMRAVSQQDELMLLARRGILESLELSEESSANEIIAKYKEWIAGVDDKMREVPMVPKPAIKEDVAGWKAYTDYTTQIGQPILDKLQYFNDVGNLIYFTAPGKSETMYDAKIQYFQQSSDYEKLKLRFLGILLFPRRVMNMFIYALATTCAQLKSAPEMLADVSGDTLLQDLLGKQFESYMMSLTYTETADEMREGFYLAQQVNNFKFIAYGASNPTHFWPHFIRGCVKREEAKNRWSFLAALVFEQYKAMGNAANLVESVLQYLKSMIEPTTIPKRMLEKGLPTNIDSTVPDEVEMSKELVPGVRYIDLITDDLLSLNEVQFIVHLAHTLENLPVDSTGRPLPPSRAMSRAGVVENSAGAQPFGSVLTTA